MIDSSNIILERLKELKDRFVTSTQYVDLNIFGVYTDPDTLTQEISVYRDKALINSVKMWMMSRIGDYYRDPTKGGVIDLLLSSPLTPEYRDELIQTISSKFSAQFSLIELNQLNIDMDVELRIWKVSYKVVDIINKRALDFAVNVQV